MQISYNQIEDFLNCKGIAFSIKGNLQSNYKICSLFYPESNGFYFVIGNNLNSKIKKSLILSSTNFEISKDNAMLVINENPQVVYYMITDYYFGEKSTGEVCKTAVIHKNAIIGKNVQIDSYAVLGNCVIGNNTIIKSHSVITDNSCIGQNVIIEPHCTVGATGTAWAMGGDGVKIKQPQLGGVIVKDNCFLGANSTIVRGSLNEKTTIGENTIIAPGARIGHGTQIGKSVHFANNVVTGGNSKINDFCFVGSSVTFRPKVEVHPFTVVGAGAVVVKNTSKENSLLIGVPAKETTSKNNLTGVPSYKRK
ncbi:hypothetical protein [Salinimicrobium sp. HB62]|uniref:hypothetical protein n=1 Tax=Salinimicrobium sp. HB62 TaxID=3077781 RepID=UPI002D7945D1|nr:hypothetical protein [Salinimicrobium sp. HB62]